MHLEDLLVLCLFAATMYVGELMVFVSGATAGKGQSCCPVYPSAYAFRMNGAKAAETNGNRKTDTSFFGMTAQPCGIAGHVGPSMRAPKFDETTSKMPDGDLRIEVKATR